MPNKEISPSRLDLVELQIHVKETRIVPTTGSVIDLLDSLGANRQPVETVWVVGYGPDLNVHVAFELARGTPNWAHFHLPTLLGGVMKAGCDRFLMVHNHPSNNPRPSQMDIETMHKVMEAANMCDLYFEDYVISTPGAGHFSMSDAGLLVPAQYGEVPKVAAPKKKR